MKDVSTHPDTQLDIYDSMKRSIPSLDIIDSSEKSFTVIVHSLGLMWSGI